MEDQLVSLETARLAKQKGFNHVTHYFYDEEFSLGENVQLCKVDEDTTFTNRMVFAPTQSLLAKWLREKHRLFACVYPDVSGLYFMFRMCVKFSDSHLVSRTIINEFTTLSYEEAMEETLKEALNQLPDESVS